MSAPMAAPDIWSTAPPAAAPSPGPSPLAEPSPGIKTLIAGTVSGRVDFDAAAHAPARPASAFPLYTRAADAIEAAVGVEIGRTIDVRG